MAELDEEDKALAHKMDKEKMFDLLDGLKAAARAVLVGMKSSPGGDAYAYNGSTSDVDWLREAAEDWDNYQMELSDREELE